MFRHTNCPCSKIQKIAPGRSGGFNPLLSTYITVVMAKIMKIYIPAIESARDVHNRVDFWFSENIEDWQPRRQRSETAEERHIRYERQKRRL